MFTVYMCCEYLGVSEKVLLFKESHMQYMDYFIRSNRDKTANQEKWECLSVDRLFRDIISQHSGTHAIQYKTLKIKDNY